MKESLKETIVLPEGMQAEAAGQRVTLRLNGRENSRLFKVGGISFKQSGNSLEVEAVPATRKMNARLKTVVGHLQNMVRGLGKNFEYKLAIVFSHFPMSVSVKGDTVEINNFAGEKNPRRARILPGVQAEVKGKEIFLRGHDKEAVGQTAANLEKATRLRGKDRRIFQDGIFIVSKGGN
jgi:large subunit ribosomal protein L6